eukprot:TRINITY_DN71100_c0_g1_i1.p1 TRINITY_DN71100_c0_g1~~TRINITY_DN71100_c0_g1_i1.p1  ORF type:complete len:561 (-),score=78.55 TRINITY_DN71100_c0_g1_i1:123-1805(-)
MTKAVKIHEGKSDNSVADALKSLATEVTDLRKSTQTSLEGLKLELPQLIQRSLQEQIEELSQQLAKRTDLSDGDEELDSVEVEDLSPYQAAQRAQETRNTVAKCRRSMFLLPKNPVKGEQEESDYSLLSTEEDNEWAQKEDVGYPAPLRIHSNPYSPRNFLLDPGATVSRRSFVAQCTEDVRRRLSIVVDSKAFDTAVLGVIILSTLTVGLETDFQARYWSEEPPRVFDVLNMGFCGIFALEFLLRLSATSHDHEDGESNCQTLVLHATLVILQVAALPALQQRHLMRSDAVLRALMVLRVFGLLDRLDAANELNMLVDSLTGSVRTLMCSISVLFLFTYVFGLPLTQIVAMYKTQNPHDLEAHAELNEFYGSLEASMLSLFQSISEGVHWGVLLQPLAKHCSPWVAVGFVLYVFLAVFAMMNILTGIFVESAMRTAEHDGQRRVEDRLKKLFKDHDKAESGILSWQELESLIATRALSACLVNLEISDEQAKELFHLLDEESSGTVDRQAFVQGLFKFHGALKSIDFASFMYEWRQISHQLEKYLQSQRNLRGGSSSRA